MIKSGLQRASGMSVEAMVQGMIDTLNDALVDAGKHDRGNSAAGTRVRKAMQASRAQHRTCAFRFKLTRTLDLSNRFRPRFGFGQGGGLLRFREGEYLVLRPDLPFSAAIHKIGHSGFGLPTFRWCIPFYPWSQDNPLDRG